MTTASFNLDVNNLAGQLLNLSRANDIRLLISIVGIPGSGKSTLGQLLKDCINQTCGEDICRLIPMDGYHYPKATLKTFPDPVEAFKRRGAPFTFDAQGLLEAVKRIKKETKEIVYLPAWDHSIGDPIENGIQVQANHQIVLFEGLYLNLKQPIWEDISDCMQERIFIPCDRAVAMDRVAKRHIIAGICKTLEEAQLRVETNDAINAELVENSSFPPTIVVSVV